MSQCKHCKGPCKDGNLFCTRTCGSQFNGLQRRGVSHKVIHQKRCGRGSDQGTPHNPGPRARSGGPKL